MFYHKRGLPLSGSGTPKACLRSSHSDSTIIADAVEPKKNWTKIKEHVLLNKEHVILKCYVPGDPLVGWDQ